MRSQEPDPADEARADQPASAASRDITPVPQLLLNAGIVFAGGTVGALLRAILTTTEQTHAVSLLIIFGINILGAFALAFLTARAIPTRWRLALGTGLCGGFTTYSTIALSAATDLSMSDGTALAAALGNVFVGLAASALGWQTGAARANGDAQ